MHNAVTVYIYTKFITITSLHKIYTNYGNKYYHTTSEK